MLASSTVENYLKAIYAGVAGLPGGQRLLPMGQLAVAVGVTPGTATTMVKTLAESGLVEYEPYAGVALTAAGQKLAALVLRRHRLIELFLVHTLKLTWDEVHDEAENMEHAVSDLLIDRIDAYLGYPAADPHGDPSPKADGTVAGASTCSLSQLPVGSTFRIVRVVDQSPDFLRYLTETGLELNAIGTVLSNRSESGTITVKIGGQQTTLAHGVADRLRIA